MVYDFGFLMKNTISLQKKILKKIFKVFWQLFVYTFFILSSENPQKNSRRPRRRTLISLHFSSFPPQIPYVIYVIYMISWGLKIRDFTLKYVNHVITYGWETLIWPMGRLLSKHASVWLAQSLSEDKLRFKHACWGDHTGRTFLGSKCALRRTFVRGEKKQNFRQKKLR